MSDFRRFYKHGLEHRMHLEQLEQAALRDQSLSVGSEKKMTAVRRLIASMLKDLAERIDPSGLPQRGNIADTAC